MGVIYELGLIKISRSAPKIRIRLVNNSQAIVIATLSLSRVGSPSDIAVVYTPSRMDDNFLEFNFTATLFDKDFGRYEATLVTDGVVRSKFYLQYVDDSEIILENA